MTPAGGRAQFVYLGILAPRTAEEGERIREILGGQTGLLGESLGRQVVSVAIGRNFADFDQALAHTAAHISVGHAERNAHLLGQSALIDMLRFADTNKNIAHDLIFACFTAHVRAPRE